MMDASAPGRSGRMPFWLLSVFAAAVLALLVGLGVWQLKRLAWKEALIATLAERTAAAPVSVTDALARQNAGEDIAFLRVRAEGVFLNDKERYFYAPDPKFGPGFDVLTPMELAGGQGVVFVDRGYVPDPLKERALRPAGLVEGKTSVVGLVRLAGTQGAFVPDNDVAGNLWYWRDIPALARSAFPDAPRKVLALTIAASEPAPGGWPNGGGGEISLSNRHFSYALTWFGLAGTLIAVYIALVFSRRRR